MSKHTPGSWQVMTRDDYPTKRRIYGYDGKASAVADVYFEDDAALIAAAPDLLAACKEAYREIGGDSAGRYGHAGCGEVLRAAIDKAEGKDGDPC